MEMDTLKIELTPEAIETIAAALSRPGGRVFLLPATERNARERRLAESVKAATRALNTYADSERSPDCAAHVRSLGQELEAAYRDMGST